MKKWPEDGDWVYYGDLMDPVKKALSFAYDLIRKNQGKDIPYDGYNTPSTAATVPNPEALLKEDWIKLAREQGEEPIDLILGVAFRLGHEQGYRVREVEQKGLHRLKRLKKEKDGEEKEIPK